MTLTDLIGLRDALEMARFSGLRKVVYAGRETEYKSDAEMKAALVDLTRKIAVASAPAGSPFVTFSTSKGL